MFTLNSREGDDGGPLSNEGLNSREGDDGGPLTNEGLLDDRSQSNVHSNTNALAVIVLRRWGTMLSACAICMCPQLPLHPLPFATI